MEQTKRLNPISVFTARVDLTHVVRGLFVAALLLVGSYGYSKVAIVGSQVEVSNERYQQLLKQQKRYRNNLAFNQLLNQALADGLVTEYEYNHIQSVAAKVVLTENVARSLERGETGELDGEDWLGQQSTEALPAWLTEYQEAFQ